MASPTRRLDALPVEILEIICSYIAPSREEREFTRIRYPSLQSTQFEPITPFRKDCKSIRLTCRLLSMLATPKAALFYDLNIFISECSLQMLENVSGNETLRHHVRRLVLCSSVYNHLLWLHTIGSKRNDDHEEASLIRLPCCSMLPSTVEFVCFYMSGNVPRTLNRDIEPVGNVVEVTEARELELELLRATDDKDLFEQLSMCCSSTDWTFGQITLILANGHPNLKELVMYDRWGLSSEFTPYIHCKGPKTINFSGLTRLDLHIETATDHDSLELGSHNASDMLSPLIANASSLRDLTLRSRADGTTAVAGLSDFLSFNKIWSFHFPALKRLHLQGLDVSRPEFGRFVIAHPNLRELTLGTLRTYGATSGGDSWKDLFEILRDHPNLDDVFLEWIDGKLDAPFSTVYGRPYPSEVYFELFEFFKGLGGWTPGLATYW